MKRHRAGFTLLELLAASALAAVLMLVLFQVIGSLARTRAALARKADSERASAQSPWKSDLIDLLRRDLANSTSVRLERDRVTLSGHGSLDRRTLAARDEPVTVVYEIDESRLVRRQSPRGTLTGERGWSELVCANVSRLSIEPATRGRSLIVPRNPLSAPLRVRIDGTSGPLINEVIVVR